MTLRRARTKSAPMRTLCGWLGVLALAGCASRASCPAGDLSLPAAVPAFAVVRADASYASSAIALLAADGTLVDPDFVDSGTRVSTLVTSLPGDVVLPTTPLGDHTIAWIDRLNYDLLTVVRDGARPLEIDVRGESSGSTHTGFSANPQDALLLDDGRILVSRLGVNNDPLAPELQRGNDVVVIEDGRVAQRIDLAADVALTDCPGPCTGFAHPAAMLVLRVGALARVLVVLERTSGNFAIPAPGAVVAIDPATLAVSPPLVLGPLENCQFASHDPDDPARAYVACTSIQTRDSEARRPHAGVAEIVLDASGALSLGHLVQTTGTDPVVGAGVIGIGAGRVLAVAHDAHPGDLGHPDHLLEIAMASGAVRDLYQTRIGFSLGNGALAGDVALVPDQDASVIVRVDVVGPATVRDTIAVDDCVGLPPWQIAPLRF